MGTFFSNAAKFVTIVVNLKRPFVFCLSCVKTQTLMIFCFLTLFCILIKSALIKEFVFQERRNNDIHRFLYCVTQIPRQCYFFQ